MTYPTKEEFVQLPYYGYDSRPEHLPLDVDEVATALFIARGEIKTAADRLKVTVARLQRTIRREHKLQILLKRLKEPPP
jgi:hypothetical protein